MPNVGYYWARDVDSGIPEPVEWTGEAWLAIGDDTPHAVERFEVVNPIECDNAYDSWKAAQRLSKRSELRQDRLREMFAATCRYGSGNCWTGDTGELARMIRELLAERERILNQ